MGIPKEWSVTVLLMCIYLCYVTSEDPPQVTAGEDSDAPMAVPMMYSDKRQHNMMRFGKRPSGHSFVRFGKRGDGAKSPQHSYLYFGKRNDPEDNILELLEYLRRNQDNSWKRGHNIMRFGKRSDSHHFIRFGKRGLDDDDSDYSKEEGISDDSNGDEDIEEPKRDGHSMLYFGKRGTGHSMMYFGKRGGHSMMYFGKRQPYSDDSMVDEYPTENNMSEDKRQTSPSHSMMYFGKRGGHSMLSFGKREPYSEDSVVEDYPTDNDMPEDKRSPSHSMMYFGKRGGHSMMYFGKRQPYSDGSIMDSYPMENNMPEDKRSPPHSMMYFGKRFDDNEGKRAHQMIHFGKRFSDDPLDDVEKRAHSMIHFGKREFDDDTTWLNPDEVKRGSHSMIHFGKRDSADYEDNSDLANLWSHRIGPIETNSKRYHSLMRFGKKTDSSQRGGSHSMIHFGKKAAHSMIHFGKRSVNDDLEKSNYADNLSLTPDIPEQKVEAGNGKLSNEENNESSSKNEPNKRMKRDVDSSVPTLVSLLPYMPNYDSMDLDSAPEPLQDNAFNTIGSMKSPNYPEALLGTLEDYNGQIPIFLSRQVRSEDFHTPKEKSSNVFLRFGKR